MGLLSSVLTLGGAAAGFALGGPAGASLGASLGGTVGGGLDQSKASKKASQQLVTAQNEARAIREKALADTTALQSPYLPAGAAGMNALTGKLGLAGPSSTSAPAPDAMGYDGQAAPLGAKPPGGNAGTSPAEPMGNALTGAMPTYQEPAPYQAPAPFQAPAPYDAGPAPTPYSGPSGAVPAYTAPGEYEYGLDDYKASPGYQYRQDQARKGVLSSASATGALHSGAALKELYDRGDQIAYQDFGTERAFDFNKYTDNRNFGYGAYRDQRGDYEDTRDFDYGRSRDARGDYESDRSYGRDTYQDDRDFGYGRSVDDRTYGRSTYENDRNYGRGSYESDRNYLTGRDDRRTEDLFRYTGIGERAAGVVSGAINGNATAQAGIAENIGDAKAGNSLQQGSIWSGVTTNVAGLASNYLNGKGLSKDLAAGAAKNPYLF